MYDISYLKPKSLKEAIEQKEKYKKDAMFIAGGSNLLVYLKDRKINLKYFIDISEIEELRQISIDDETVSIGPSVKISEIEDSIQINENAHLLHQATLEFANPLIKNKATIGGNIADASPAADMAPPLLALDACITLASINGEREVSLKDFFINPRKTDIKDNEIISRISFKKMSKSIKSSFIKLGIRNASTISTVSIAIWLSLQDNKINDIHVALGSVAPTPVRSLSTENLLKNQIPTDDLIEQAMNEIQKDINPISDIRGSSTYRKEMCSNLLKRAINQCLDQRS